MTAWRIASARHASADGAGGLLFDARWHHTGNPVLYASSSLALATLEKLVHTAINPARQVAIRFDVPAALILNVEELHPLPADWPHRLNLTQAAGSAWLKQAPSAALSVPSAIIPLERNLILNPLHPDFHCIAVAEPFPYLFDPRLF